MGPNRLGAGSTWAGTIWAESTWGRNDLKPTLVTHLCVSLPSTSTDQGRKVNMKTDGKF